jgi:hypothetical protein
LAFSGANALTSESSSATTHVSIVVAVAAGLTASDAPDEVVLHSGTGDVFVGGNSFAATAIFRTEDAPILLKVALLALCDGGGADDHQG